MIGIARVLQTPKGTLALILTPCGLDKNLEVLRPSCDDGPP